MRTLKWIGALAAMAATAAAVVALAADEPAKAADGKALFTQFKCNSCHTVKALGIAKQASAEDEKEKSDRKPPDLSGVGKEHNAAWMAKYLMKLEEIDGEKHRKKFRGTEAELKTITGWLELQKADKKSAK